MFYLLFILIVQQVNFIAGQQIPSVPCPDIFEYYFDGNRWSGIITVPTPDVYNVVLTVNFTVGELISGNGELILNDNKNAIINIENYRPFQYTLNFPRTRNIPQVTGITYNGNTICVGPGLEPPYSSFWLSNTLNWYSSEITFPRKPNPNINDYPTTPPYRPPTRPPYIPPTRPPYSPPTTQSYKPPTSNNIFPENPPQSHRNKNKFINNQSCGMIRNKRNTDDPDVIPFIYNGTVIPKNNHPWLAALYNNADNGPLVFFCAGNLISNKHVLSAAHCTLSTKNIQVKVGAHDSQELFTSGSILRDAVKIMNHDEYVPGSAHADISLLLMNEEVTFSSTIKPICLWNTEENINNVVGRTGTIMGWGLTENRTQSTEPLQTDITIASQQECQSVETLKNSISDSTFCAGRKGAGPCLGDSGGGFFMKRRGRWYLRGIISTSIANSRSRICDVNTYSVFVDTAQYIDWIVDKMK